jgi:hypothetical protein
MVKELALYHIMILISIFSYSQNKGVLLISYKNADSYLKPYIEDELENLVDGKSKNKIFDKVYTLEREYENIKIQNNIAILNAKYSYINPLKAGFQTTSSIDSLQVLRLNNIYNVDYLLSVQTIQLQEFLDCQFYLFKIINKSIISGSNYYMLSLDIENNVRKAECFINPINPNLDETINLTIKKLIPESNTLPDLILKINGIIFNFKHPYKIIVGDTINLSLSNSTDSETPINLLKYSWEQISDKQNFQLPPEQRINLDPNAVFNKLVISTEGEFKFIIGVDDGSAISRDTLTIFSLEKPQICIGEKAEDEREIVSLKDVNEFNKYSSHNNTKLNCIDSLIVFVNYQKSIFSKKRNKFYTNSIIIRPSNYFYYDNTLNINANQNIEPNTYFSKFKLVNDTTLEFTYNIPIRDLSTNPKLSININRSAFDLNSQFKYIEYFNIYPIFNFSLGFNVMKYLDRTGVIFSPSINAYLTQWTSVCVELYYPNKLNYPLVSDDSYDDLFHYHTTHKAIPIYKFMIQKSFETPGYKNALFRCSLGTGFMIYNVISQSFNYLLSNPDSLVSSYMYSSWDRSEMYFETTISLSNSNYATNHVSHLINPYIKIALCAERHRTGPRLFFGFGVSFPFYIPRPLFTHLSKYKASKYSYSSFR